MNKDKIIERGWATCEEMEELSDRSLDRFMIDNERIWGYTLDEKFFLPFNNIIQANIWGLEYIIMVNLIRKNLWRFLIKLM